jgi:hypothetical protein
MHKHNKLDSNDPHDGGGNDDDDFLSITKGKSFELVSEISFNELLLIMKIKTNLNVVHDITDSSCLPRRGVTCH